MNLIKRLRNLFPGAPLLIGTVTETHADGTLTVQLAGGGQLRVRGDGFEEGDRVFVRDGVIEGSAPALPVIQIEI